MFKVHIRVDLLKHKAVKYIVKLFELLNKEL